MKRTPQKKLTKKQMQQVEEYLLYNVPGYRWMKASPHLHDEIEDMDAMQAMRIVSKSFRYYHLHRMVSGDCASDGAKQQRRNRWTENVRLYARVISDQTNVSYRKVFYLLYDRMFDVITK